MVPFKLIQNIPSSIYDSQFGNPIDFMQIAIIEGFQIKPSAASFTAGYMSQIHARFRRYSLPYLLSNNSVGNGPAHPGDIGLENTIYGSDLPGANTPKPGTCRML